MRLGLAGLGKMGLSHLAIANMHPEVTVVAACDTNTYLRDVLDKHTGLRCYGAYSDMLAQEELDAIIIATPSKLHASMVDAGLRRGLHVFCEKPFVLNVADGVQLVSLAEQEQLVTQVGYHFRFVAAFQEAARIVQSGALGKVHHVRAEAYGPVVVRQKAGTWRSARAEGGGALYDYACHAVDLVNFIVGVPTVVEGAVLNSVFSSDVEDEIYCSLRFAGGASGQLAVNWSDESHRKMSTKISVWGSNGRITADRQECQIYLRQPHANLPDTGSGWTVRYTTDLTPPVAYYLRGEEYTAQLDYFVESVRTGRVDGTNSFRSALAADAVVSMIAKRPGSPEPVADAHAAPAAGRAAGWLARVFK